MIIVYQEMREFLVEIQSKAISIMEVERMTNNKNIVQLHIHMQCLKWAALCQRATHRCFLLMEMT